MMRRKLFICFLVLITGAWSQAVAQMTMTSGQTAANLVQNVLLGSGVTVSNVTYNGAAASIGTFDSTGPGCNIGLSHGIYMSSGTINPIIFPLSPATVLHSSNLGTLGDPTLDAIVSPRVTQDAAVIEFDFIVAADSVAFRYVFGSEEYNEWVNTQFNDVFGFFISGPGIVGVKNLALIPGTTTPVSINNVNNGNAGGPASGPCVNCAYYVDNVGSPNVFMDGFTTVLTAKTAVVPCQTYHIKLAIADVSDGNLDSGVFLEANSFSSFGQIALFANGVAQQNEDTVYACDGDSIQLCLSNGTTYNWTGGATTQCIWVNQQNVLPTHRYLGIITGQPGCFAYSSAVYLEWLTPTASITPSGPLTFCYGDSVVLTANTGAGYQWSNGATSQSVTAKTTGYYKVAVTNLGGCTGYDSVFVNVDIPIQVVVTGVDTICAGQTTTLTASSGFNTYLWNTGATTSSISTGIPGTYYVHALGVGNICYSIDTIEVVVNPLPVPVITGDPQICAGDSALLDAGPGYFTYSWNNGSSSQSIYAFTQSVYSVSVADVNGCTGTATFNLAVNALPTPVITGSPDFCDGDSTLLNAGGGYTAYQWNNGSISQFQYATASGIYTVVVTDANGCSGTDSFSATKHANPVPVISGIPAICIGDTTILDAGAGYNAYVWNTGNVSPTINAWLAGNYQVTVTDINGCTGTDSLVLTLHPLPLPVISGIDQICNGDSSLLDAGPGFSSYQWSNGTTGQTTYASQPSNYSVVVTDINGCSNTASLLLQVIPLPVPVINGTSAFCEGDSVVLNVGPGFVSYLWNTGAVGQQIYVNASGNYNVVVADANGCTGTASFATTMNLNPVPALNGLNEICIGDTTVLDAGSGYAVYNWNTGNTTSTINAWLSGNYMVTVTDLNGCSGTDSVWVTVNPLPVPVITGIEEICDGDSSLFDAGVGFVSYQWSNGASGQSIYIGQSGSYSVIVTDLNGCSNTAALDLTVHPLPVPLITGITSFCEGDQSILNAGAGFNTYLWNDGTASQALLVDTTGVYTVTVSNVFGCIDSASVNVTMHLNPVPALSGTFIVCDGTSGLIDAGNTYQTYVWSNGETTSSIAPQLSGTYQVTVTDMNGCSGSASQDLLVKSLPSALLAGSDELCFGDTTSFTVALTGTAPFTLTLSDGASQLTYQNILNTPFSQTIIPGATATYTLISITDSMCTGNVSGSFDVTVHQLPQPEITGKLSICDGESTELIATSGFNNYVWSNGQLQPSIVTGTAGLYTVTVTDQFGCTGISPAVNLLVRPIPVIDFSIDSTLSCEVQLLNFNNHSIFESGSLLNWNFGDGNISSAISPSHQYAFPGAYTASLQIISPYGCTAMDSIQLNVGFIPLPVAAFITSDRQVNMLNGRVKFVDRSFYAVKWLWEFGDGTQATTQNAEHVYDKPGEYIARLTIWNIAECEDSYEQPVTVNPTYFPNAFTPNGDGINDNFFTEAVSMDMEIASYRMEIYNRWGQLVFVTDNKNAPWYGLDSNNEKAPSGTYIYRVVIESVRGNTFEYTGQVNLIR